MLLTGMCGAAEALPLANGRMWGPPSHLGITAGACYVMQAPILYHPHLASVHSKRLLWSLLDARFPALLGTVRLAEFVADGGPPANGADRAIGSRRGCDCAV